MSFCWLFRIGLSNVSLGNFVLSLEVRSITGTPSALIVVDQLFHGDEKSLGEVDDIIARWDRDTGCLVERIEELHRAIVDRRRVDWLQ